MTATASWIGNPVLDVAIFSFTTATRTGDGNPVLMSLNNVPPGTLLIATVCQNSATAQNFTVTSSPTLTWTSQVDAGGVNTGNSEIWSAYYTAGGNVVVTAGTVSGNDTAGVLYALTGVESNLSGAENFEINGSAPSVTVVTTKVNSILFGITIDWNGIDGAVRTLRDTATETFYYRPNGNLAVYGYYKQCTTIASHTLGVSSPGGQAAATAVLEIRNSA